MSQLRVNLVCNNCKIEDEIIISQNDVESIYQRYSKCGGPMLILRISAITDKNGERKEKTIVEIDEDENE